MPSKRTAIVGPARSGKTTRLLERYLAGWRHAAARRLWLVPSERAARLVRRQLASTLPLGAILAPQVFTFGHWCRRLVERLGPPRSIGPTLKRRLLEAVIHEELEAGHLTYFRRIARRGSFVDLVANSIAELKNRSISPSDFVKVSSARATSARNQELASLYAEYEKRLAAFRLVDREDGVLHSAHWLRRADASQNPATSFELVVVDGFADFTRSEMQLLVALAGRTQELIVSLPDDGEDQRADLFARPRLALAELRRLPDFHVDELGSPPAARTPLEHLERHLFRHPQEIPPISDELLCSVTGQVEIVAAAGSQQELIEVARRIKRLLLETGSCAGEIAVVFRSLSDVAPRVREVFGEFGIPHVVDLDPTLGESPSVRSLLGLLRLDAEDWPLRLVAAVVDDALLTALVDEARPAAAWLVRELQIVRGRGALLQQVARLAEQATEMSPDGSTEMTGWVRSGQHDRRLRRALAARLAMPLLERLSAELESLPDSATPRQWTEAIERAAVELGLLEFQSGANGEGAAAWHQLKRELLSLHTLAAWQEQAAVALTRREFLQLLTRLAHHQRQRSGRDESGSVRVLSAVEARNISVRHLFVAGLSEQSFPAPERAGRLLTEADYEFLTGEFYTRAANREGAGQPRPHARRTHDEMLLFYDVLTRATETLTLSYPALDRSGQPLPGSPFVTEVQRAFGDPVELRPEPPNLMPVEVHGPVYSREQFRIQAVAEALGEGKPARRHRLLGGLFQSGPSGAAVERGLEVVDARSAGDAFGQMEGVFSGIPVRDTLRRRFGSSHLWSPSALETYAACPFRFFLGNILHAEPLAELSLDIDYLRRGSLLHHTLAQLHREIQDRPEVPSNDILVKRIVEIVDGLVHGQSASDLQAALVELDRRQLLRWAPQYAQQLTAYISSMASLERAMAPKYFELRFGPPHHADSRDDEDPQSTDEPLVVDLDDEQIRISGRIDRIDVGTAAGRAVFNVIDYKTTSPSSLKKMDSAMVDAGKQLQLPLYVMAAEMVLAAEDAVAWQAGYWSIRGKGFDDKKLLHVNRPQEERIAPTDEWEEMRTVLSTRLAHIVKAIRRGEFPMHNEDEHCTSHCEFSTVCRVAQTRSLGKQWPPEEVPES